jgi:hypothetical protein
MFGEPFIYKKIHTDLDFQNVVIVSVSYTAHRDMELGILA